MTNLNLTINPMDFQLIDALLASLNVALRNHDEDAAELYTSLIEKEVNA